MALWLGYCRKSLINPHARREVESTDRQRDRLIAWATARGDECEVFVEPDGYRSGATTKHRPAYQRMLQRIQRAKKDELAGVVVTRLDRTSRSPRDFYAFLHDLNTRELQFVALDQQFDSSTPHGRMILGVLILLAEWERSITSDRAKEAIADRQGRGRFHAGKVYGYDWATVTGESGHTQRVLVPNPIEAERVNIIFQRFVSENIGGGSLARFCNSMGWTTKHGRLWTTGSIFSLLGHVWTYRGMLQQYPNGPNRQPSIIPGAHEPIIDQELAQAVIAKHAIRTPSDGGRRSDKRTYPLSHHIWCGECGSRLVGQTAVRQAVKDRYRCRKDRYCRQSYFVASKLEGEVWAVFAELRAALHVVGGFLGMVLEDEQERRPVPRPAEAAEIQAEIDRLDYLYQRGRKTLEVYERERNVLEERLSIAEATVDAIGTPGDPLGLHVAQQMLARFDEALAVGSNEALAEVVHALVDKIVVKDGAVVSVQFIPPIERLRMAVPSVTN